LRHCGDAAAGLSLRRDSRPMRLTTPTEHRMTSILMIILLILDIAFWIIIVQAVLSWLLAFNVLNVSNSFVRSLFTGLARLTEPVYRPIRNILPDTRPMDLAPLVVLIGIFALQIVISNNARALM
jgi:YggT family protein